jgi:DNA polymerase III delta prime subunit
MSKNKKTFNFQKKELTGFFWMEKSQKNQSDNKIGFVINPEAKLEEQLAYILTTQKENPGYWDIWSLGDKNDENKKRSVREYAQALFILLSYAIYKTSIEDSHTHSKLSAIRIYRTDDIYGHWIRRVFDVITATKEYQEIPVAVRDGLRPLLVAVGRRGEKGRVEIAGDCMQRVFFWSIEPFNSLDLKKCVADKKPLFLSPVPHNSFELAEIHAFSQQIRNSISSKTWMDLYRKYAIEPIYAPSARWLKTLSLEIGKSQSKPIEPTDVPVPSRREIPRLKTTGLPLDIRGIIQRSKNVFLTGPAGSGKTTAFKLLANEWLCEEMQSEKYNLPFYVQLKESESFLGKCLRDRGKIEIADLIGWSVFSVLCGKCTEEELKKCETIQQLALRGYRQRAVKFTCGQMLTLIQNDVTEWFQNQGRYQTNVLVLIDGINELNFHLRNMLKHEIEDLSRQNCRIAVSCRSNFGNVLFSDSSEQITRFELQGLDSQQIIDHLKYNIPGRGEQIFEFQIKGDQRLLSMAKNPFYLSLIVERLKKDPRYKIPVTKANLISDFIECSIERKRREKTYAPDETEDDMIDIVLPKVAKWSIDVVTSEKNEVLVSFPNSKEFNDIHTPKDVFKTLKLAESYGLLSFSGRREELREHRGYPSFVHDNFRDFFAALYLKSLGKSLLQQLPTFVEYFTWDEPLLLFLELCENEDVCRKVTEFALSKDVILGGMCARHANVLDKKTYIQAACQVESLPERFEQDQFLHNTAYQDDLLRRKSSPTYVLERFSVTELIAMAQDKSLSPKIIYAVWLAVPETVAADDFVILKNVWAKLPKMPKVETYGVLAGIARIPTLEALDFFIKAYQHIHTLPSFKKTDILDIGKTMFGPTMFHSIGYNPSLSQAVSASSPEEPHELSELLSKVSKINPEEIPLVEKLLFHNDGSVASQASELLVRTIGEAAFDKVYARFIKVNRKVSGGGDLLFDFYSNQLFNKLLSIMVSIAPERASTILLEEIKHPTTPRRLFSSPMTDDHDLIYLRFLSETYSTEALKYLLERVFWEYGAERLIFYADSIEKWSDRALVLSAIREKLNKNPEPIPIKLLGAWLGAEEFYPEAVTIFHDLFSQTVLRKEGPPPTDPFLRSIHDRGPQYWHMHERDKAMAWLPLALRAVRKKPDTEIAEKVLQIIEWQYAAIDNKGFELGFSSGKESSEVLAESLHTLSILTSFRAYESILEKFLRTNIIKNLFGFIDREGNSGQQGKYCSVITSCLIKFCESVPEKYVPELFSIVSDQYKQCIQRILGGETVDLSRISQILVSLCLYADDEFVLNFLRYLKSCPEKVPEERSSLAFIFESTTKPKSCQEKPPQRYSYMPLILLNIIKLAKGRRFLAQL